jgi:hypothetical protein
VLKNGNLIAATLITVILALLLVGSSFTGYADTSSLSNATATPTVTPTITPTAAPAASVSPSPNTSSTPTPTPVVISTPVPTPGPRQVFSTSSASWDGNHVTINAVNSGEPITIVAWINSQNNSATVSVGAGESLAISTPSITTINGQIVSFGFEAYDNGTLIDSYNNSIAAITGTTPTPLPQENVVLTGLVVANNGSPIAGAIVTFTSMNYDKTYPSITTGSAGSFTTAQMYPDIYTVQVTAGGYQSVSMVTEKITGSSSLNSITMTPLSGPAVSTSSPTPSPSPSIVDSWTSIISSPQVFFGTLSALVAVIAGSLGIYEWLARQRSARLKKEKEEGSKSGEIKDTPDVKKP